MFPNQQLAEENLSITNNTNCIQNLYQKLWGSVPFTSKFLITLIIALFTIDNLLENKFTICSHFSDKLENSIFLFQLWRFFTSLFINHCSLQQLLYSILLIYFDSTTLESVIGSATYFLHIFYKSTIIQLIQALYFIAFVLLFQSSHYIEENHQETYNKLALSGLWPVIISDIFVQCIVIPHDQRTNLFFIPIKIKNITYTFIILLLTFLINLDNFLVILPLTSSFILGLIEAKFFNGMILRITKSFVKSIENFFCCPFKNFNSFIKVDICSDSLFRQVRGPEQQFINNNQINNFQSEQNNLDISIEFEQLDNPTTLHTQNNKNFSSSEDEELK